VGVPRDTVGDRLTLALRRSGLEDYEVAEKANVTPAWLSAVKNDRIKTPPLDKLRAVAKAVGVPLRYLTEPMGVVPIEEEDPRAKLVIGGRAMGERLTEGDLEEVARYAEYLEGKNKES
jgi:transcriptional regulator with XRE-family HTH domain